MPATLKEIAKYSGVSIATVSLALNNKAVCARTREKVLKAAEKLQYRPSTLARSLRTQKTYTLGLTLGFPNLELIDSVVRSARARGYHVITMPYAQDTLEYDKDQERQAYQELLMRRVDGVLAWPSEYLANYSLIFEDFRLHNIPVVVVDRQLAGVSVPSFVFDNRRGALLAWLHMHNLGRDPIIYLDFEYDYSTLRLRRDGVRDGMLARGVCWNDANYVQVCGREGIRTDRIREAIKRASKGGAIFAAADHIAFAVLRVAHDMGVRMPENMAVVGFEDVVIWLKERVGWTTSPALTTVRMQFDQIGREATEHLLDCLEKNSDQTSDMPQIHMLEPLLVVRKSCGGKSGIYGFDERGDIKFVSSEIQV